MITPLMPGWTWAAVTIGLMAGSGIAGYRLAESSMAADVARAEHRRMQCEQYRERDARAAAEKTAALLSKARQAEADAAARLAAAQADARRKIEETRREIYRLSTGRECLSGALRLRLNSAIAADDLPKGSGGADPAAAAAADDTAVAAWALDVARLYDDCRARIDAISAWDEVTHGR